MNLLAFVFTLLDAGFETTFQKLVTPKNLYILVLLLACTLFCLVFITYLYQELRKRSFFARNRIKKNLELWISNVILDEDEGTEFKVPPKFRKIFKDAAARQYAIDSLLLNKRSFSGFVADNIVQLYEHLGFKDDSLKKLQSRLWFEKAKGIQELYLMDQKDQLIKVYRLTNSRNEFIRMEAQTAIIHWAGFNGLRFLDVVTYPISEWQQIKLLEQLRNFQPQELPKLSTWLKSDNDTVVILAIKLAAIYQQFQVQTQVAACLQHPNEAVRIEAVKALPKIGDGFCADMMIKQYYKERFTNKLNILNSIYDLAESRHIPFVFQELDNENDFLKLAAAKTLARLAGTELLESKANAQPEPYLQIYKHVKQELAL
jgi:hypothetical protein